MYIHKMIFMERDEVSPLEKYGYNVLQETDYGTTEIVGDSIQGLLSEVEGNSEDYDFTKEELMEDLNSTLGTDTVELLLNGGLDFILVVY